MKFKFGNIDFVSGGQQPPGPPGPQVPGAPQQTTTPASTLPPTTYTSADMAKAYHLLGVTPDNLSANSLTPTRPTLASATQQGKKYEIAKCISISAVLVIAYCRSISRCHLGHV